MMCRGLAGPHPYDRGVRGPLPLPDPTSPAEIAAAMFPKVRKGFDPQAVGSFLRAVADEITRLHEVERSLSAQLSQVEEQLRRAMALDEAVLTQVLGEEATRVLQTAREAAASMRERAEAEVARLRDRVELDVAARRGEIAGLVEAELERCRTLP